MKTTLLLPLILITGFGSYSQDNDFSPVAEADPIDVFMEGCRKPVLDTREASAILFQTRLDEIERDYGTDTTGFDTPLFIARCGAEFVLFNGGAAADPETARTLYLRYQDKTYELVGELWA